MLDDWIILIPENPDGMPDPASQERARARFSEIAPEADEVEVRVENKIDFFHCGGNYERIVCPSCRSEIPNQWWQDTVDQDYDNGFKLARYPTPCCGTEHTLHELTYEWPQGFCRFAFKAMNPNLGLLDEKYKRELEEILGTPLPSHLSRACNPARKRTPP